MSERAGAQVVEGYAAAGRGVGGNGAGSAVASEPAVRLGYLIPEFPGQTHIFFRREANELARLGIAVRYISTRLPDRRLQSHDWCDEARKETAYLFSPKPGNLLAGIGALVGAGPRGWMRVVRLFREAGIRELPRCLAATLGAAVLCGIARREEVRHVHVHSCGNSALIAAFANRLCGLSYSVTLHGPLTDYGPLQPLKWRFAAFAVVITHRLIGEVKDALRGALPPVIKYAPMGVELDRFTRRSPYLPWAAGRGPARIVSVGRLNFIKGHQDLIVAVAILNGRGIPAELTICGEDEAGGDGFRRDLQARIDAAGLSGRVALLGAVSEARVHEAICRAHVFALASFHEPLGVAIMEAMALGAPVVATNAGGVPELVADEVNGLLVEPRSPDAIADALERLLADGPFASRIGAAGRAAIEKSFQSNRSAIAIAEALQGAGGSVPDVKRNTRVGAR